MTAETWDFFDSIVCLTNNEQEWAKGLQEFVRVGLGERVRKFQARPDIGPHQSFSRSERRILIDFYGTQCGTLLHLEDDCVFHSLDHLPAALAQLPEDWDILYLGANIVDEAPERFSRNLYRVRDAWTTHAIAYNRKVIPTILENQPGFSERMYDNFLGSLLPDLKAFVVNPMIAWQRPRFSSIWQRDTNYDEVFLLSQNKLHSGAIHVVTFADENMTRAAELCEESARRFGADGVWRWSQDELRGTEFYEANRTLLDQARGCGYWAWKPFIILDTLLRRCDEGDILIYADAGVEFIERIDRLVSRLDQDVFLFGNSYQHAHWCKRDVVEEILPSWPWEKFDKQVQASVIMMRATAWSKWFVNEWLRCCLLRVHAGCGSYRYLIDDSPSVTNNHPEFREHRHDQAILTCLAYRENLRLHWWPAIYNGGAFTYEKGNYVDDYPTLFHHHRKRNNDW